MYFRCNFQLYAVLCYFVTTLLNIYIKKSNLDKYSKLIANTYISLFLGINKNNIYLNGIMHDAAA